MYGWLDLQKDKDEIARSIEVLQGQANACLEDCKEYADSTNYAHYIQLQKGTIAFNEALEKFLSGSSKRPHGKLEFIFNNAIEYIGGGQFMAEHSGFELTNGRALDTLEKFDKIAELQMCALHLLVHPKLTLCMKVSRTCSLDTRRLLQLSSNWQNI